MLRISAINLLLVGILLLNLFMLGTSRIRALIQAAAVQGVVLGVTQSLMSMASIVSPVITGLLIERQMLTAWAWLAAGLAVCAVRGWSLARLRFLTGARKIVA